MLSNGKRAKIIKYSFILSHNYYKRHEKSYIIVKITIYYLIFGQKNILKVTKEVHLVLRKSILSLNISPQEHLKIIVIGASKIFLRFDQI